MLSDRIRESIGKLRKRKQKPENVDHDMKQRKIGTRERRSNLGWGIRKLVEFR